MPETDVEIGLSGADSVEQRSVEITEEMFSDQEREIEAGQDTQQKETEKVENPIDYVTQTVLEFRRGSEEDWQLVDKGSGEYHWDAEHSEVVDRDGNVWTNPDRETHEQMRAQWREGGNVIFFLPEHTEERDGGDVIVDTLYVTHLELDKATGEISWAIHAHETVTVKAEALIEPTNSAHERTEPVRQSWNESFERATINETAGAEAAAFAVAAAVSESALTNEGREAVMTEILESILSDDPIESLVVEKEVPIDKTETEMVAAAIPNDIDRPEDTFPRAEAINPNIFHPLWGAAFIGSSNASRSAANDTEPDECSADGITLRHTA